MSQKPLPASAFGVKLNLLQHDEESAVLLVRDRLLRCVGPSGRNGHAIVGHDPHGLDAVMLAAPTNSNKKKAIVNLRSLRKPQTTDLSIVSKK